VNLLHVDRRPFFPPSSPPPSKGKECENDEKDDHVDDGDEKEDLDDFEKRVGFATRLELSARTRVRLQVKKPIVVYVVA
jgi:hypothetical protein